MKHAFLTVGPQGAGKSTLCKEIKKDRPEISLISRDDILVEIFGTVWLSAYSDGHFHANEIMWKRIANCLKKKKTTLILDTWNGYPHERVDITKNLRDLGVDIIEAWRFVTPEDTCAKWFVSRENPTDEWARESKEDSCRYNYKLYHEQELNLEQGFDVIRTINPLQKTLWPYSYLLT